MSTFLPDGESTEELTRFYRVVSDFYDDDYAARDYKDDIPYYVGLAEACAGPVLEMGCGTGRILIPSARAGANIHGIDLSNDMLDQLKESLKREPEALQRRVSLSQGDMRTFRLNRRFALVTAPFRSVQHLLGREDQRRWLRSVSRHLKADGLLAFDVFQPDFELMLRAAKERSVEADYVHPDSGLRVVRTSRTVPQPEFQLIEVRARWEIFDSTGALRSQQESSAMMRWFVKSELESLLELEGFEIVHYWGDFDRSPFGRGSPQQIVEARLTTRS